MECLTMPSRLPHLTLLGLVAMTAVACGGGGTVDLLTVTPNPAIHADPAAAQLQDLNCKPLPEKENSKSHLVFDGPCRFVENNAVRCVHPIDDFYVYIHRDLDEGGSLVVTINLEHYQKPGTYAKITDVLFQVTRDGVIYPWVQHEATATVSGDEKSVTLQPAGLVAPLGEPSRGIETVAGVIACNDSAAK
jgi:hypothetical protein